MRTIGAAIRQHFSQRSPTTPRCAPPYPTIDPSTRVRRGAFGRRKGGQWGAQEYLLSLFSSNFSPFFFYMLHVSHRVGLESS